MKYYDYETMPMGSGALLPTRNINFEKCLDFLDEINTGKIIEIGCGGGQFVSLISCYKNDLTYFGTDISKQGISIAHGKAQHIHFCVSDATMLPFKKESFDVIIVYDVYEHILDVTRMIEEIRFALRENGILISYIPCEGEPFTISWFLKKIRIGATLQVKHFGHIQNFTKNGFEELLKIHRFDIIKKEYGDHFLSQIISMFIWVLPKEIISWFGHEPIAIATESFEYTDNASKRLKIISKLLLGIKKLWIKYIHVSLRPLMYYYEKHLSHVHFSARGLYIKCKKTD